ncbi:integrin-like protein [Minicystis rosea]|nr:integrin-like protein [Minicystis rosea]
MRRAPSFLATVLVLGACAPAPPPAATVSTVPSSMPAAPSSVSRLPPPPPQALAARRIDRASRAALVWAASEGAAGYEIEVAVCAAELASAPCRFDEGRMALRAKVDVPRFAFPRRAELSARRFAFRVRACTAGRCSAWSEPVATSGRPAFDFNGDGYSDMVVLPRQPPPTSSGIQVVPLSAIEDMRRARVFYGGPNGLLRDPTLLAAPDTVKCAAGACCTVLGAALAAGDLNGDGFDDLAVAATTFCHGKPDGVLLYYGSREGLPPAPSRVLTGPALADFGQALSIGDLDGDGFADVVVGAPGEAAGAPHAGAVYVYRGSAEGVAPEPRRIASPKAERDARFGASVAALGDVDGDGRSELAVGAVDLDTSKNDAGAVFVLGGGDLRLLPGAWTDAAGGRGARFGYGVVGSDVNGDGFADLIVDAALSFDTVFRTPRGNTYAAVSAFLGARDGLARTPFRHHAYGRANWNRLAAAGDVNGDGFDDFVLGRPHRESDNKAFYLGDVQLYLGAATGPSEAPSQVLTGGDEARRTNCSSVNGNIGFGERVAGVGDVNGDGFDDVAVICTGRSVTLVYAGSPRGLDEMPQAELAVMGVMR